MIFNLLKAPYISSGEISMIIYSALKWDINKLVFEVGNSLTVLSEQWEREKKHSP
jgi:hypothetical protein